MRRYAFIDVPNTTGTAWNVLNFLIDWKKLHEFLVNGKWSCTRVFFYKGHKGGKEKEQLDRIADIGYSVRTKLTHVHPDWQRTLQVTCVHCHREFPVNQLVKGNRKSNCDVERTVDALEILKPGDDALIFTGDGDFAYMIEILLNRGVTMRIISSKNRDSLGKMRFSTRLSDILKREERGENRVQFIHLKNWQKRIEKLEA